MIKGYLSKKDLAYFLSFGLLCLGLFVFGLFFVFTSDLRGIQNDKIRAQDFQEISYSVSSFYVNKGRFPVDLKELDTNNYGIRYSYYAPDTTKSIFKDPQTEEYYDFNSNSSTKKYSLCTTFEVGSAKVEVTNLNFSKGYNCVEFDATSSSIKPYPVEDVPTR